MIDVRTIIDLHRTTAQRWHREAIDNPYDGFLHLICQQHQRNFLLWHQEDLAREPQAGDQTLAEVTRTIQRLEHDRTELIEKIDTGLLNQLEAWGARPRPGARINTETPGSVIDRLSMLSLRSHALEEQLGREDLSQGERDEIRATCEMLQEQLRDLSTALIELLDDIVAGRKRLKVYRLSKVHRDCRLPLPDDAIAKKPAA
jgi:hypothetical protein